MTNLYDVTMILAFVAIFCVVHVVFKNIRQIFLLTCKCVVTIILWSFLWVATQLHHLPEWKTAFSDSVWRLVNMTKGEL